MTQEFWVEKFNKVLTNIKNYENGKFALTKTDLTLLYEEKQFWMNKCQHWDIKKEEKWEYSEHSDYTGSYSSKSLYVINTCLVCNKQLKHEYLRGD